MKAWFKRLEEDGQAHMRALYVVGSVRSSFDQCIKDKEEKGGAAYRMGEKFSEVARILRRGEKT